MSHAKQRRALLKAARGMSEGGLTQGTSGNISLRVPGGMLITPTGMPYGTLKASDLVFMSDEGQVGPGQRRPSSEWRIHLDVYRKRPDVHAVVHAHPMFCTTFAILRQPLRAVHYMIGVTGSAEVPCAPYATYGTADLSSEVLGTLKGRNACLLANHGLVVVGKCLDVALKMAFEVEQVAELQWRAQLVGKPHVLGRKEMARVIALFETYGQQRPARS
jgi:L-fuculose-phosphate aldolase